MKISMTNGDKTKECSIGMNFIAAFKPGLAMIFNGDWKNFGISLVLTTLVELIIPSSEVFTAMIWIRNIVLLFSYNKIYINSLISDGYKPATTEDAALLYEECDIDLRETYKEAAAI